MVVQIHTASALKITILPLCRIAVPVFFIISGYFMVNKDGVVTSSRIQGILIKILKITIFSVLIYLSYHIALSFVTQGCIDANYTKLKFWIRELAFGSAVNMHLWYLTAYLQLLVIFYITLRIKKFPILFILIPLGVLLNLLLGRYIFLISDAETSLDINRNVLTIAIPCVLIGILIRSYEHKLPSQKKTITALIIATILLYAEQLILYLYFPQGAGDIIIFTIPVAILTFITFLRLNATGKTMRKISQLGKRHSMDIYLWHPILAYVFIYIHPLAELKR